jgi:hypothetical protein
LDDLHLSSIIDQVIRANILDKPAAESVVGVALARFVRKVLRLGLHYYNAPKLFQALHLAFERTTVTTERIIAAGYDHTLQTPSATVNDCTAFAICPVRCSNLREFFLEDLCELYYTTAILTMNLTAGERLTQPYFHHLHAALQTYRSRSALCFFGLRGFQRLAQPVTGSLILQGFCVVHPSDAGVDQRSSMEASDHEARSRIRHLSNRARVLKWQQHCIMYDKEGLERENVHLQQAFDASIRTREGLLDAINFVSRGRDDFVDELRAEEREGCRLVNEILLSKAKVNKSFDSVFWRNNSLTSSQVMHISTDTDTVESMESTVEDLTKSMEQREMAFGNQVRSQFPLIV